MTDLLYKKNPLFDFYESLGYRPEQRNGSKEFFAFSSLRNEYDTLYNGVGLRDISTNTIIELSGNDVLDFLNRITTNEVKNLSPLESTRTIFTNDKGRILDSVQLINFGTTQLIIGHKGTENKLINWMRKYIIMDDVKVESASEKYAVFELTGLQVNSFMTLICGNQIDELKENHLLEVNQEGMNFFVIKLKKLNTKNKYLILANPAEGMRFVDHAINNKGVFEFHLIGNDAYETFRIEQGQLSEKELSDNFNPHEAKILDEVSFTKGCYIGQEVIARLETYNKVQRYITGVKFNEVISSLRNFSLYDNEDNEVGVITSSTYSEYLHCWIGLAYIRKAFLEESTILIAKDSSGNSFKVTVKNLPFRA